MNTKKWTMKDGNKIRIKDMSDTHLYHTIKMLERKHKQDLDSCMMGYAMLQGEMAQYYAERALEDMWSEEGSTHPLYYDMVEEANKRKIFI